MEPLEIRALQREYCIRRNDVKFEYANAYQNLKMEYMMKLRKQQTIRDKKLMEIDREEDEKLQKYRIKKALAETTNQTD